MTSNCWTILGIEPTEDSQAIQSAYARLLKFNHPEDNPEGFAELKQAYEAALNYANQQTNTAQETVDSDLPVVEQTEQVAASEAVPEPQEIVVEETDNLVQETATQDEPVAEQAPRANTSKRKFYIAAGWLVAVFVLFRIFAFLAEDDRKAEQTAQQDTVEEVYWEPDLLLCNDVYDATVSPEFDRCLALAKEGWEDAQRRIAWAYTREGDTQDWAEAYDYIRELGESDYYMDFLGDIVLFLLGETESSQIKGERQIRAKANLRFPPAEGYLATIYGLELNLLERDANIIWLLESAYEKSEVVIDVYEMTQIYANGIRTRVNLDKARAVLADYADSDSPFSIENTAWYLATLANNQIHPPEVAVQMAQTIVDYEDESELYSFYDTLAAAYAANQQFEEAVSTQQQAIALIDKSGLSAEDAAFEKESYTERLASYQQQQAVTYADLTISDEDFFDDLKTDIEVMLIDLLNVTVEAPDGYVLPQAN